MNQIWEQVRVTDVIGLKHFQRKEEAEVREQQQSTCASVKLDQIVSKIGDVSKCVWVVLYVCLKSHLDSNSSIPTRRSI